MGIKRKQHNAEFKAGGGGAFGGEDPGAAVGGVWGSSTMISNWKQELVEACGRIVCARQQGAVG